MPKINIKTMLHNVTEEKFFSNEGIGILLDNKLKFIDDGITVIIEFKDGNISINRSSDEYDIYMPFELNRRTTGIYNINSLGALNLEVEASLIKIEDNKIELEYQMIIDNVEVQKFNYKIEYEEM